MGVGPGNVPQTARHRVFCRGSDVALRGLITIGGTFLINAPDRHPTVTRAGESYAVRVPVLVGSPWR